ncbi:MAG: hypothetical protein K6E63_02985 [Lachnospiraceae bacterium]|nr:hypothetical protein [Lachnospiraceae bacterium]
MNTKKIPLFIMLLAGAVACIVTYLDHYNLHDMLVVLLAVLIIFLIVGLIVKKILDKFEISNNDSVDDEGEVVEKPVDEAEGSPEAAALGDEEAADGTQADTMAQEGNDQEQEV